jgi:hypothetical protein
MGGVFFKKESPRLRREGGKNGWELELEVLYINCTNVGKHEELFKASLVEILFVKNDDSDVIFGKPSGKLGNVARKIKRNDSDMREHLNIAVAKGLITSSTLMGNDAARERLGQSCKSLPHVRTVPVSVIGDRFITDVHIDNIGHGILLL